MREREREKDGEIGGTDRERSLSSQHQEKINKTMHCPTHDQDQLSEKSRRLVRLLCSLFSTGSAKTRLAAFIESLPSVHFSRQTKKKSRNRAIFSARFPQSLRIIQANVWQNYVERQCLIITSCFRFDLIFAFSVAIPIYKTLCRTVRPSVDLSVCLSVCHFAFSSFSATN